MRSRPSSGSYTTRSGSNMSVMGDPPATFNLHSPSRRYPSFGCRFFQDSGGAIEDAARGVEYLLRRLACATGTAATQSSSTRQALHALGCLSLFKTMEGKNAFAIDWEHPIVQGDRLIQT